MPYYPKDVKSWDKSIATATPAAAIFFCEFLAVFTAISVVFQGYPSESFKIRDFGPDSEAIRSTV